MIIIVILLVILAGISAILFFQASPDSRLGFMGAVIGLPASILITVTYNDYLHRRDYVKSIKEDYYSIINGLQNIAGKAHRLNKSYDEIASSSDQTVRRTLLSVESTKLLTDTSVLSDLLSSIQSFYKKRKMRCWSADDSEDRIDAISDEEYRSNDQLRPLIAALAILDEVSTKDPSQTDICKIRNACYDVYQVAGKIRTYFESIEKQNG